MNKSILERYNIKDKIEIIFERSRIILMPVSKPREGWEDSYRIMNENREDALLIPDIFDDESED